MTDPLIINNFDIIEVPETNIISTPPEFSWKDFEGQDWTTPAKAQGNCGSCWDFAAMGAFESVIKIREGNPNFMPDLSEQYVLSCLPAAANHYGQGCFGGTPYGAFFYMMDTSSEGNFKNGAIPESCFPYKASHNVPCSDKCEDWENYLVPILDCYESYLGFDSPQNRAIIKSLIYEGGPIAAAMNVSQDFVNFWNFHHSPNDYFPDPDAPWGNRLNHIIVIVGWVDDSSIDNGGYWICKNSWGTDWGYQGFYNIEYGALFTGFYIATVDYDPNSYSWSPTPPIINGPNSGGAGIEHVFSFKSEDLEFQDNVSYFVDWGDGSNSGWLGPFESGEEISINHTWSIKRNYMVMAKSKDKNDHESQWSSINVNIPRFKISEFMLFSNFIKFFSRFLYFFN